MIPVPDFLTSASIQLPPSVAFFADVLMFPEGFQMIATAYTARFILRRIPGIG
jgi:hypothetical protein